MVALIYLSNNIILMQQPLLVYPYNPQRQARIYHGFGFLEVCSEGEGRSPVCLDTVKFVFGSFVLRCGLARE